MSLKPKEEVKIEIARLIPAHNGFGTDEDSLCSRTGSLMAQQCTTPIAKMTHSYSTIVIVKYSYSCSPENVKFGGASISKLAK